MKFFHLLTYAIVLGFFAVACAKESPSASTAHLNNNHRNPIFKNRLPDTDLLPVAEAEDSTADALPQQ